jgi:hypothetical protein
VIQLIGSWIVRTHSLWDTRNGLLAICAGITPCPQRDDQVAAVRHCIMEDTENGGDFETDIEYL